MTTLYLHIGTPKTGTTAIQVFLQKNRNALKEKGCSFPDFKYRFEKVRSQRNGHFLSSTITDNELRENCFSRILKDAKKFSKIILTDEVLWNLRSGDIDFWKKLDKNLAVNDIKLNVIVYLRRQDAYFASHWAQKVKGVRMASYTFCEFLENNADTDIILDYYSRISLISSIIGKENVIIRPYEFNQFKDNSIIADFMNAIGVELDDNFVIDNTLRNVSVEGNVLEVKRYLNRISSFRKNNPYFQTCLVKVQNRLKEEDKYRNCSTYVKNMRSEFMEKYTEGNKKLAVEYLNRKDGILFENPLPTDDPQKNDYSIKELKMILDMICQENALNPDSPVPPEKFQRIADRAFSLILDDKSTLRKIKNKIKSIFNH